MNLFYISGNTVEDIKELSRMCGTQIGGRTRIVASKSKYGIENVNAFGSYPVNMNLLHLKDALPANDAELKEFLDNSEYVAQTLTTKPIITTIDNEVYVHTPIEEWHSYMDMTAKMVMQSQSIWRKVGAKVSTSGVTTSIMAAMAYNYYAYVEKDFTKMNDFVARWPNQGVYGIYFIGHEKFNYEYGIYRAAGVKGLLSAGHFNVDSSNIDCFEECLIAFIHYSAPYE